MLNQELIGKRYPEQRFDVTAEAIRAYARATNDANPAWEDEGLEGPIAPPMFAIVAAAPSEMLPVFDEALTGPSAAFFQKMVRGDNEIVWSDVIRPGDVLTSTAVVGGIDVKPNGELLRVDVTLRRGGREIVRVGCGYFVRGETGGGGEKKAAGMSDIPRGPVMATAEMVVAKDQPLRYADASGDRNPIHTDDAIARAFGHPGVILQGSCTMAFAAKAVVDELADGKPARLKRLRVRYARPVLPGDTLTTMLWRIEENTVTTRYGLEMKRQDGTVVIKNAFADVAR